MPNFLHDLLFSLRRLARAKGFALTAISLLTVAFAANACVFSVAWCLAYKPLPVPNAERVVRIGLHFIKENGYIGFPADALDAVERDTKSFDGIAGYWRDRHWLKTEPDAEPVGFETMFVQPQFFGLLGMNPIAGRLPNAQDTSLHDPAAMLVSQRFAVARYGNAQAAIDQTLALKEGNFHIIGVLGDDVPFGAQVPLWRITAFSNDDLKNYAPLQQRNNIDAIARLADGTLASGANREVGALALAHAKSKGFPDELLANIQAQLRPLRSLWIDNHATELAMMLLTALLLMLITGVNVCNLYIARAALRQHENAMLIALGAAPARRLRLVAIEALLLVGASAIGGLVLAPLGLRFLAAFDLLPGETPFAFEADRMRVAFAAALALAVAIALIVSALWLQRGDGRVYETLKQGGARQTAGASAQRARAALIVVQIALTCALLFGSGLLLRSAQRLLAEDVGFDREHLIETSLALDADEATYRTTLVALRDRAAALPGVASASLAASPPFGTAHFIVAYQPPGSPETDVMRWPTLNNNYAVDAGYFATIGQTIVAGRAFTADEVRENAPVVIVDREFVRRNFADGDALGRMFKMTTPTDDAPTANREVSIVGVVNMVKSMGLDEPLERPTVYQPGYGSELMIRTRIDPATLERALRELAHEVAPRGRLGGFGIIDVRLQDMVRGRYRLNTLLEMLGVLTLALAGIGLYAVLAYAVRMRTGEFGVRLALGAAPARVRRDVLVRGIAVVAVGLALGLPLAWAFARALTAQLYGVTPLDPATLVAVVVLIAIIGVAASWWPARIASRVDPTTALRAE